MCRARDRLGRITTVAHGLPDTLKVLDGYQATLVAQGIAGLVPFSVGFAADYVQEVACGKREVLSAAGGGVVVVDGFDDLLGQKCG